MIKWRIKPRFEDTIEPVEVVKGTECFVVIREKGFNERRVSKNSDWGVFFDSFEEAKEALIDHSITKVKYAEEELQREKARLKRRNDIKKPAPPATDEEDAG